MSSRGVANRTLGSDLEIGVLLCALCSAPAGTPCPPGLVAPGSLPSHDPARELSSPGGLNTCGQFACYHHGTHGTFSGVVGEFHLGMEQKASQAGQIVEQVTSVGIRCSPSLPPLGAKATATWAPLWVSTPITTSGVRPDVTPFRGPVAMRAGG